MTPTQGQSQVITKGKSLNNILFERRKCEVDIAFGTRVPTEILKLGASSTLQAAKFHSGYVFLEANVTLSDFNNFYTESSYEKDLVCQILC